MNHLFVGEPTPEHFLATAKPPFLLIDSGPVARAFQHHFPDAAVFDYTKHSIGPLHEITEEGVQELAELIYNLFPQGENTLTVRNGKRALATMLANAERLDQLPKPKTDFEKEAVATVRDLLFSPIVARVLTGQPNFSFNPNRRNTKNCIIAKLDRTKLRGRTALAIGLFLIAQAKGHQIIVPELGFYGRDFHVSLIEQKRLSAGLKYLDELSRKAPALREEVLLIKDKVPVNCLFDDAETLAKHEGFTPGTNEFSAYLAEAMGV